MTLGELKNQIKNLGFEETATMTSYSNNVCDAINRAMQQLYDTDVQLLKWYFKQKYGKLWGLERPSLITTLTADTTIINFPDELINLVPLYASYFVWLDDDVAKATYYYNQYIDMKNDILNACGNQATATIQGGVRW